MEFKQLISYILANMATGMLKKPHGIAYSRAIGMYETLCFFELELRKTGYIKTGDAIPSRQALESLAVSRCKADYPNEICQYADSLSLERNSVEFQRYENTQAGHFQSNEFSSNHQADKSPSEKNAIETSNT